jgi:hypothetical protein
MWGIFSKHAARRWNSVLLLRPDTDVPSLSLSDDSLIRCRRFTDDFITPSAELLRRTAVGAPGSLVTQLGASFKIIANSK